MKKSIKTKAAPTKGLVVLGLGGTIAGISQTDSAKPNKTMHYLAAQLSVQELLKLAGANTANCALPHVQVLEAYQVAQIDSKDMAWPVWRALLEAATYHLARPEVSGLVITHGTDTLEETAVLLHLLLNTTKPVVLTAAMRPATSPDADGYANLIDALAVTSWAAQHGMGGVVVVMARHVWSAAEVRKSHTWQIDAFDAGGLPPLATVETNRVLPSGRSWPTSLGWKWHQYPMPDQLPNVLLLTCHADADTNFIKSLLFSGTTVLRGLVLAGTGHGTLPECWEPTLRLLHAQGVTIWRSSRVARGGVHEALASGPSPWPAAGHFTAAQARLALSLALWCCPQAVLNPPCPDAIDLQT